PVERRAAAVGENEAARPACAPAADAVRVGEREQQPRVTTRVGAACARGTRGARRVRLPLEIARHAPGPLQRRPVERWRADLCAQDLETRTDIRIACPRAGAQQIAFRQLPLAAQLAALLSQHA